MDTVLSARALNRALLERQLLTERSAMAAQEAVAHLLGLQAQAVNPPYIGLWTRLARFTVDDVGGLLLDHKLVRMALMRSTIHLVTARDSAVLRPLLAEMLARTVKSQFGKQLTGVDLAELARAGAELAAERPLSFAELGGLLAERWPGRDANALAQTVRNLVPLVQIPPRGLWGNHAQAVHVTAGGWLGQEPDDAPEPAEFVVRYLAAFGPASILDMQKWSGLTRLREVFTGLGPRLRTYRSARGTLLFDLAEASLPDPALEVPVRFLPEFDNILLSHADRSHILRDQDRHRVFTNNGIIRSTILVDGVVAGLWNVQRSGDTATLVVAPFSELNSQPAAALAEEGVGLLRFTAPDAARHEMRFEPPG
jgi:hypothetical protein